MHYTCSLCFFGVYYGNYSLYSTAGSSYCFRNKYFRGGSRTAATVKMERFMIIFNDWKPLAIITKRFIFGIAAVLDPPLKNLRNELPLLVQ